jgi:methyl-accepting chemotaxis protein
MRLLHKFFLGFALITLVTGATGLYGLYSFSAAKVKFDALEEDIVPGALFMLDTRATLANLVTAIERTTSTSNMAYWQAAAQGMPRLMNSLAEYSAYQRQIGEAEGRAAEELEQQAAALVALLEEMVAAVQQSNRAAMAGLRAQIIKAQTDINNQLESNLAFHQEQLTIAEEQVDATLDGSIQVALAAVLVTVIIALGAGYYLTYSVLRPVRIIRQGSSAFAAGNLDHRIDTGTRDELGELGAAFNAMAGSLQQLIESERASKAALEAVVADYTAFVQQVAAGDLTARLQVDEEANADDVNADLRQLGLNLNSMVDSLSGMAQAIREASDGVIRAASEIQAAVIQQTASIAEQDAAITQTVATVEEVRQTVSQTADRAQAVAESSRQSAAVSRQGQEVVAGTILGMQTIRQRVEAIAENILRLSEQTQQIGEIINTVNTLADQSKLLALNASIEAARAGEEGRGFAVVAMEVRQLAEQSRQATARVRGILGEIQQATNTAVMVTEEGSKGADAGMTLAEQAGEAIRELAVVLEEAMHAAMQIAASTHQQTNGMNQVAAAMAQIQTASSQAASSTNQTEESVHHIVEMVQHLENVVTRYRI